MPAKQQKKQAKKQPQKSSRTATAQMNDNKPESRFKRQTTAVILFAVAILLLFIIIIKGEKVWSFLHNVTFGLFGICAIILPIILGGVAVMLTLDKTYQKIRLTIVEAGILIILIGALVQSFMHGVGDENFLEYVKSSYIGGLSISGGGALGAILSYPLLYLLSEVGARILLILSLFVVIMLITNTTLKALFSNVAKPVKKIHRKHIETEKAEEEEQQFPPHPVHSDYPLDLDDPPRNKENTDKKRKRLLDSFNDNKTENDEKIDEIVKRQTPEKADKKPVEKPIESPEPKKLPVEKSVGEYKYPPMSLLSKPQNVNSSKVGEEMKATAQKLVSTLQSFGIETRIINISRGPSVTRYELEPAAGVRINKIKNLEDNISMSVAAQVRIEAPIPNTSAVGIEVPNKVKSTVMIRETLESAEFSNSKSKLSVALGKDITGKVKVCDLAKMPHMLIAGTTGSGKSVCTNSMIVSILYNSTPDEVKLLLIDPKVVEFGMYNGIPQLLVPVVTDPQKAAGALGWAVVEMEKRYKMFADCCVRDLNSYNKLCKTRDDLQPMPQIVIIIDELADLMMTAKNEVETSICRLAQKARAAGMHMVVATQRPSVDVITGLIKANIPSRIALTVKSSTDSRTMIDIGGAEKLLGYGDMLYSPMGVAKPLRVQGCYVDEADVANIVNFIKQSNEQVEYDEDVINEINRQASEAKNANESAGSSSGGGFEESDPLTDEAISIAVSSGTIATSLLQRKLKIGYGRAARIIDEMEERGIVGPFEGKSRRVLINKQQWLEMQARKND